ncbi:MAG: glycosyltransferase family 4 protein [Clostridium sp.]|nr:glycosyltransferase family 4 protein [Clostridium sp.]
MNIIIISTGILPQPAVKGGAVETLVDSLINYNEKYLDNNIKIYSIYDKQAIEESKKYLKCKFKFIKINNILRNLFNHGIIPVRIISLLFLIKVSKDIKENEQFDIILLQNQHRYSNIIKKLARNKPIILHLHNDYINCENRMSEKKMRNFNYIITVSDYLNRRINEVNNSLKVKTIHNGISLKQFNRIDRNCRDRLRQKYGIKNDEVVIVYAGRLVEEKGIKELILAFNDLPKEFKIRLLVIGSSFFDRDNENKFIKELKEIANKKKDKIIFTGFISNNKINRVYSIADIGCIPSLCEEAFGLTVVEQMAIGLPLIVSNSGAIPEIVNKECAIIINKDHAYIEKLRDAMIELYKNENIRNILGSASKERAKNFSDEIYAKNMFGFLDGVKKLESEK